MLNLKVLSNNELENVVGGGAGTLIQKPTQKYGYVDGLKNTVKAIIPFCTPEYTGEPSVADGSGSDTEAKKFGYLETVKANFGYIDGTGKKVAVGATLGSVPVVGVAGIVTAVVGGGYLLKKYVIKK